ncbi:MAG: HDIG domain-containing protein [Tissierellales bacterium]|nr:HDIG domain-containing protein [Tissierellales bacterium]MBN2828406.1 HDIG domain-containing protein [Tissierellales bacterium]
MEITRERALELFNEYVTSESLIKHCLAVEGAMRGCAEKFNEDVEVWGVCGLLHDIDFQRWPEEHLKMAPSILKDAGYPDDFINAVLGHGDFTLVPRETNMAKCLYAVDQLASFIIAVALMRPDKLHGMTAKSVKKKMKDKAFARAVDRTELQKGADELQMDMGDLITLVIEALQKRENELNEMEKSFM